MPIAPSLRRLIRSLRRVADARYPSFLFGGALPKGEIPVFIYHAVSGAEFRADLEFLRRNGYECLRTEEYLALQHSPAPTRRAVLLTFDDAVGNFHEVTLPLLREYSIPATLFVPTFWMRGPASAPNTAAVDPTERDGFMSWEQLRECRDSGLVDIQLHGHRHALVHTSTRLVGFATPELLARHHLFDWPMRHESGQDRLGRPALGTPAYEACPLLGAHYRVLEDETAARACREHVAAHGGPAFFERPHWNQELLSLVQRSAPRASTAHTVAESEFRALIASEFRASCELFARELGERPRYLAYPWQLGSKLSLELAQNAGVEAAFGVGIDHRRIRRLQSPLPLAPRLKGDWLRFLPGRGRRRLRDVLPGKIRSFVRSQHLAH